MPLTRVQPGTTRLGWVGTGVMGRWMCQHAIEKGYAATVYNRSPEKAAPLVELGAKLAKSPKEVAAASDVVFVIVGYPHDVREVVLGENGVLAGAEPGTIVVDSTTNEPGMAQEIAAAAKPAGVLTLDAPVTGGDIGAKAGTLSILVGGDPEVFEAVRPLFEVMGKTIVHHGADGAGHHAKMVNQILISSTMVAVCEGMLYGHKAGLNMTKVLQSVSVGAAGSKALEVLGPRMLVRNFDPGFYVEHFLKDMGIALAEAEKMRLALPGLGLAKQLFEAARAQGHGRSGTQALLLALERLNGIEQN
jgi:3-hydroxyisobutyrate dehydrogenase